MDGEAKIRLLVLGAIAATALLYAGCSSGGGQGADDGGATITHPGGDGGCPLVDGCDGPQELLSTVTVEIQPPVSSRSVRQYATDIPYAGGEDLGIGLRPTVNLCGEVRSDTPNLSGAVFASINNARTGAVSYQTTITPDKRFCIRLPTGEYKLQCIPDDQGTPPLFKQIKVENGTRSTDFNYPSGDSVITVEGRVIVADDNPVGVDNLYVRAYDPETGISSNTAITSETLSDGVGGKFSLTIPARTGLYSVSVFPSLKNPDWPSMVFPDLINGTPVHETVLSFGELPTVRQVRGTVVNAPAMEGTLVEFSSPMGKGAIYKSVVTDDAASFTTTLREGTYLVMLTPPSSNATLGAAVASSVVIPPPGGELSLQAGVKRMLSGIVKYPDGAPGKNVTVKAMRMRGCGGEVFSGTEQFETAADSSGAYSLSIDEGSYEVRFVPPGGVNNAGMVKRGLCVKDAADLTVTLPRTALVTGTVLDSSGEPVANAVLNFYLDHATASGDPVPAGSALTGADGKFHAALPDISYK